MKVLMISLDRSLLTPNSSGAKRFRAYARYADALHVIVLTVGGNAETYTLAPNVYVHSTAAASRWGYHHAALSRAAAILNNARPLEWVISAQDPFDTGLIAWRIARRHGCALHVQDHQDCFNNAWWKTRSLMNRVRYCIARFVVPRADALRAVSERTKWGLIALGAAQERVTVVPMHTPIAHIAQGHPDLSLHDRYGKDAFVILYMGRFAPEKNIPLLLDAFTSVARAHPHAQLVMVGGGGEEAQIRARIAKHPHGSRIHVEAWSDDVVSWYKTADIFALPSWYEGWGRVLIESLAARLPIVTTDVGCVGEVVKHEETALVVPIGDTGAFACALSRLAEDEALRARFKAHAPAALAPLMSREETDRAFFGSIRHALESRAHQ